ATGFTGLNLSYCTIHDCGDFGIEIGDNASANTHNIQNALVDHCFVSEIHGNPQTTAHNTHPSNAGIRGSGILVSHSTYSIIQYSSAVDCADENTYTSTTNFSGPVGIWFVDSDHANIQ